MACLVRELVNSEIVQTAGLHYHTGRNGTQTWSAGNYRATRLTEQISEFPGDAWWIRLKNGVSSTTGAVGPSSGRTWRRDTAGAVFEAVGISGPR